MSDRRTPTKTTPTKATTTSKPGSGKVSLNPSRTYKKKPSRDEIALNPSRTYKEKLEKPEKPATNPKVTAPAKQKPLTARPKRKSDLR